MGSSHEANWDRLGEFVSEAMQLKGVPGVALGILHKGETRAAGFGVTNVDHPLPVTDETLFQIGSNTKTFTGTLIMQLVEMGKIDLDATVRTYVPEFKVADETVSAQATIRHLLTHVGGWTGDFFHDTGPGGDAMQKYVAEMADLEQLAPLGTVWSYNNSGFYLAGYIIERVTGKSYEAALKDMVLEPLGMQHSFFDPGDVITHRFAVGHNVGPQGAMVARPWPLPRAAWPAGGIACDVHDLLRYSGFHMGDGTIKDGAPSKDGEQLLKAETLSLMQTPQTTVWNDATRGLSWALQDVDGTRLVFHGGGTMGQVSQMMLIPAHEFAIVVFTNADQGGFITQEAVRWALQEYLDVKMPKPEPIEASEEELAAFVGTYSRPMMDIETGMLGGRLIAQMTYKAGFPSKDSPPPPPPPPVTLGLCEKDRLIILDGMMKDMTADVIRNADGSIGWIRAGGRIHKRQG